MFLCCNSHQIQNYFDVNKSRIDSHVQIVSLVKCRKKKNLFVKSEKTIIKSSQILAIFHSKFFIHLFSFFFHSTEEKMQ
jgi:hypothetical protein